jgi:hypothetical protein
VLVSSGGDDTPGATRSAIPRGNLLPNPSFEQNLDHWDTSDSKLSRIRVPDAPDGRYVVQVEATKPGEEYSIDNDDDAVKDAIEGQAYTATAYVKGTEASDGQTACLQIRERPQGDSTAVRLSYDRTALSASRYKPLGTTLVAKGAGNRIDAYVFGTDSVQEGDAFRADAMSMVKGGGGATTPGRC